MLTTSLLDGSEACANFHSLNGIDTHQCAGNIGIELVEHGLAQPYRHNAGYDIDARTDGVSFPAQRLDVGLHLRHLLGIWTKEGVALDLLPIEPFGLDRAELGHIAANLGAIALT